MGNYNNNGSDFKNMPDPKYYNLYTDTTGMMEIKGDATRIDGTGKFYGDEDGFLTSSISWLDRGGRYDSRSAAGIFANYHYTGVSDHSTRFVVATW